MPTVSLGAFNYDLGTLMFETTQEFTASPAVDGIILRPPVFVANWNVDHIAVTKLVAIMRYRHREVARATQPFTIQAGCPRADLLMAS